MIRSTKISLKHLRKTKRNRIISILNEYRRVAQIIIDILWEMESVPKYLNKEFIDEIKKETNLPARMLQAIGLQCISNVKGTKSKQNRRLFMIKKLMKEGKISDVSKIQSIYDKASISKPKSDNFEMTLDSRFVKIDCKSENTIFDGWVTFSPGDRTKIEIPFNFHRHFLKLYKNGKIKNSIKMNSQCITFVFELPDKPKKESGKILGIDIGQTSIVVSSDGNFSQPNKHGHDLKTISERLSRKRKGSKGFHKEQEHRKNYINWAVNRMNLDEVKTVRREDIKNLRKGRRTNRSLEHWTYRDIINKIDKVCEEQGVLVEKVNPTFTSQRCSNCGWTQKSNRNGKLFKCKKCGHELDSDLNGSINIALPLSPIYKKKRCYLNNIRGFFWNSFNDLDSQEIIVPDVLKT